MQYSMALIRPKLRDQLEKTPELMYQTILGNRITKDGLTIRNRDIGN